MDLRFTLQEEAFRKEVRDFIHKEMPSEIADAMTIQEGSDPEIWGQVRTLRKKLAAKGWIGMSWPKEYGGMGASLVMQAIFKEEMAYWRCPGIDPQAYQLGPAIIIHGSEEQKKKYLGATLRAEITWCQGFSEPNAGSDLAGLQTRAVKDGDDFLITGQKIWTSYAHVADTIHLLARSDPDAPKHRGISYFLFPTNLKGITIKPIRQMDNGHGFNEVYFENVRVPKSALFGELNRGWYVATTTLDFERSNIAGSAGTRRNLDDLIAFCKTNPVGKRALANPIMRNRAADLAIKIEVARMMAYKVLSIQSAGKVPNMEASVAKLFSSDMSAEVQCFAIELLGIVGAVDAGSRYAPLNGQVCRGFLRTGCKVGGGSPEIQRNVIAQRGLGLPR
jgi:alkylation response protein AidB-like acyl-CoA dehydrogenase